MEKLTAIEYLDSILSIACKTANNNHEINISTVQTDFESINGFKISLADLRLILNRLVKDGYLCTSELNSSHYLITFDGVFFNQAGAYKKQTMNARESEIRKDRYELRLLWGTWAVALGAIGLVLWEMVKTFCLGYH